MQAQVAHETLIPARLSERRASIRHAIQALSTEQRQALVDEVVDDLASKGLMKAVSSGRLAQGDVLHGVLGAWMVRHYGTRLYGPDCDKHEVGDLFAGRVRDDKGRAVVFREFAEGRWLAMPGEIRLFLSNAMLQPAARTGGI